MHPAKLATLCVRVKREGESCFFFLVLSSKVLLPLFLLIDGVLDGLPFCLVTSSEVVDFPLHLGIQVGHPLLKLFKTEKLELHEMKKRKEK